MSSPDISLLSLASAVLLVCAGCRTEENRPFHFLADHVHGISLYYSGPSLDRYYVEIFQFSSRWVFVEKLAPIRKTFRPSARKGQS